MSSIINQFEKKQIESMSGEKSMDSFGVGDTVIVTIKIVYNNSERFQKYQGVVIAKRNKGICSSFLVRKVNDGGGVEKRFMIYSPTTFKIEIVKRGAVRRAKLFYLRGLSGKASKIKEKRVKG